MPKYRFATPARDAVVDLETGDVLPVPRTEPQEPPDYDRMPPEIKEQFHRVKRVWEHRKAGGEVDAFTELPEILLRQNYGRDINQRLQMLDAPVMKEVLDFMDGRLTGRQASGFGNRLCDEWGSHRPWPTAHSRP